MHALCFEKGSEQIGDRLVVIDDKDTSCPRLLVARGGGMRPGGIWVGGVRISGGRMLGMRASGIRVLSMRIGGVRQDDVRVRGVRKIGIQRQRFHALNSIFWEARTGASYFFLRKT